MAVKRTDGKCKTCIYEHLDKEHPTCDACMYYGVNNHIKKDCDNCKYDNKSACEEPCRSCRGTARIGSSEYNTRPHLWESPYCIPEPTETPVTDNVDHPSHYNQGGIECIDAMVSAFGKESVKHFCICNAFKYVWRADHKNGIEDIDKAIWYLNKVKELSEE